MTDLLAEQASIRARRSLTRDTSGQFMRPDKALAIRVAAERMKARLLKDVKAAEHARGVTYEHGHYRPLPNGATVTRLIVGPRPGLFDIPAQMEVSDAA